MIATFIATYGYLAVFIGTLLEGETILIAAGIAAHQGLLDWPIVILVAMAGGTLGDQLMFLLGRWKGDALIERHPRLARHKPRVRDLLVRHNTLLILSVRFLYGLRIAGPLILGSFRVPVLRFALLNTLGAALWASLVTAAGYTFGVAISALISDIKKFGIIALVAISVLGLLIWLWRRYFAQARS